MTINDLVTSLEMSKKLREAGVPQESVFYWNIPPYNRPPEVTQHVNKALWEAKIEDNVSAFTVKELTLFILEPKNNIPSTWSSTLVQDLGTEKVTAAWIKAEKRLAEHILEHFKRPDSE